MIFSTKYSYLVLRIALAAVFFWFGVHKFLQPEYWLNAWIPTWTIALVENIGIGATQFVYLNGILEILIGLSLLTGVLIKFFSLLGVVILLCIIIFIGISEVTIRDLGLLGALLALFLWPEQGR